MHLLRLILPGSLLLVAACSPPAPYDGPTSLTVTVEGQTHTLAAGSGRYWDEPIYNSSNSVAYVLRKRVSGAGSKAESIAKVTKDSVIDPVFQCSKLQGSILKLHSVSTNGERVLVALHFVKQQTGTATYYGWRPVILDLKSGTVSEVEF